MHTIVNFFFVISLKKFSRKGHTHTFFSHRFLALCRGCTNSFACVIAYLAKQFERPERVNPEMMFIVNEATANTVKLLYLYFDGILENVMKIFLFKYSKLKFVTVQHVLIHKQLKITVAWIQIVCNNYMVYSLPFIKFCGWSLIYSVVEQ